MGEGIHHTSGLVTSVTYLDSFDLDASDLTLWCADTALSNVHEAGHPKLAYWHYLMVHGAKSDDAD